MRRIATAIGIWLLCMFVLAWDATAAPARGPASLRSGDDARSIGSSAAATDLMQFRSGGHVVGFTAREVHLAGMGYVLTEELVGASGAEPLSDASRTELLAGAPSASRNVAVQYRHPWPGVVVRYAATPGGIMESTFTVEPRADLDAIRLRYNARVGMLPDGSLQLTTSGWNGHFTMSAPVAWQSVDGQTVPVDADFELRPDGTVGFRVGRYDRDRPLTIDPTYQWHTFHGSAAADNGSAIALDSAGNVYVVGTSEASWGTPLHAHSGWTDIVVMKLSSAGVLQWHTFYGQGDTDYGQGIAIDSSDNVYVVGRSRATWGSPLNLHSGYDDIVVLKLDTAGTLLWHTFQGSWDNDYGNAITVRPNGDACVTGISAADWGVPVNSFQGPGENLVVACLNSAGVRQWHTFAGGPGGRDEGRGITADANGNLYVVAVSNAAWGSPVNAHSGFVDMLILKLDSAGARQWHTFHGSNSEDDVSGVAVDSAGSVYAVGSSRNTWGSPLLPHNGPGAMDITVLKLDAGGVRQWHTFLGCLEGDMGYGIVRKGTDLLISGWSYDSWGSPVSPHNQWQDVVIAKLGSDGTLGWNTFYGSSEGDENSTFLALDAAGDMYLAGTSTATWGGPVSPHNAGNSDITVMKVADTEAEPTLTVVRAGTGSGTVTSDPAGIDCGSTCTAGYANATSITLTATAEAGSVFVGWSGGVGSASGCTGTGTCVLELATSSEITASFDSEGAGGSGGVGGDGGTGATGASGATGGSSGGGSPPSDDDGCAVRSTAPRESGAWLPAALVAIATAVGRRRRERPN